MKKDCRHLQLVPTVEEHKTRMEKKSEIICCSSNVI